MSEGKEKFTPGPWIVKRDGWGIAVICKESVSGMPFAETPICDIAQEEDTGGIQDAALIAAAPDMYAQLDRVSKRPSETIEMLQREGFVFDNLDDRWQKLAFSLYTSLVELGSEAKSLLAKARGEDL